VAHDERRRVERLDDAGQVLDGLRDREVGDDAGVLAERLDLDVESGIRGCQDPVALGFVVRNPVLLAARGHPESVYQYDGVRGSSHASSRPPARAGPA